MDDHGTTTAVATSGTHEWPSEAKALAEQLAFELLLATVRTLLHPACGRHGHLELEDLATNLTLPDAREQLSIWWYRQRDPQAWAVLVIGDGSYLGVRDGAPAAGSVPLLQWYTPAFQRLPGATAQLPVHGTDGRARRGIEWDRDARGSYRFARPTFLQAALDALSDERAAQDEEMQRELRADPPGSCPPDELPASRAEQVDRLAPSGPLSRPITLPVPAPAQQAQALAEAAIVEVLVPLFESTAAQRQRAQETLEAADAACVVCLETAHPNLTEGIRAGAVAVEWTLQQWLAGRYPLASAGSEAADRLARARDEEQREQARQHWVRRETAAAEVTVLSAQLAALCPVSHPSGHAAMYGAPPEPGAPRPIVCAHCGTALPTGTVVTVGPFGTAAPPSQDRARKETNTTDWVC